MRRKRIATSGGEVTMRARNEGSCQIHDWPTDGLAKRLVEAMRERAPQGINACRECIERATVDAKNKRKQPSHGQS